MNTQPTPEGGQTNGAAPRSSGDLLVDRAMSAFDAGLGSDDPVARDGRDARDTPTTRQRPRKQPAREPAAEPEGPGAEEPDEDEEQALPGAAEDDEAQEGAEGDGEDEEAHDTRGSKDEPFSVKDLPADKFIQLKVDGEKVTVSLRELGDSYIGQRTINARLNKTKSLTDEATQFIEKAKSEREQVRGAVRELLSDSEQLYDYFLATGD